MYFGVLRAIDNLNAAISEEKAIKKQLDQAQQRYEVGLSAITGVQEAQLAYDLSKASKINAEGNLYSAKEALNALIGREIFSLNELGDDLNISPPYPNSKEEWVELALKNNYQLKASKLRKNAAKVMQEMPHQIIYQRLISLDLDQNQKQINSIMKGLK